ncbi:helix-turn-helix transcriptional regulator [Paenibacillus lignilyticus]|uniref:Helix-turn-helix transcriptional regulator n=1 Tax=Paenibacillus lignilyticus TaxID=1172615 RepID=A0ABS5C929_9BACL|nr:helix-turn-helix transcriptional regulator [Paenibacillus lignilyticus]MBP3962433.1 helix-turn-helix transcriptional regulator [Paenibacillus lignilyticus]
MRIRKHGLAEVEGGVGSRAGGVHPYGELLCITEGEADLEWSGMTYHANGTALFVILPNTPHQLVQRSHRLCYWFVEFHEEDAAALPSVDLIYRWNSMQSDISWSSAPYPALRAAFEAVRMLMMAETSFAPAIFQEALLSDLHKLLVFIPNITALTPQAPSYSSGEMLVTEVLRFLESVFPQSISLQTIADYTHYNPSYLVRLFRQHTGKTPFSYLNELRLAAASQYLLHSDMTVQHVSQACGFQSIHYFSRTFKKQFGMSPSEWRKPSRT